MLVSTGVLGLCLAAGLSVVSSLDLTTREEDTGADADEDEGPVVRSEDDPPNIVVFLVDDAGYADFGFTGSESFHTPRIDALAAESVRFTNGYVTASLCSPSRAALLTGRYQQRFGHELNPPPTAAIEAGLPRTVTTLADLLRGQGYKTAAIGKWHLGIHKELQPNQRGFDYFYGFLRGERTYFPQTAHGAQAMKRDNRVVDEDFEYLTDELGADAARWIDAHAGSPFFLYLAYGAVHMPLEALQSDLDEQDPDLVGNRRRLAAMTASLDRSIGLVLDALDEHDLADDTIVFFVNDNGAGGKNEGDNAPYRGGKSSLYEGGVRVPFTVRWPGVATADTVYDAPVSTIDIAPTALAAAGLPLGKVPLDGVDLAPWLGGKAEGVPHEALFWRQGTNWAVRQGDLKLVETKGKPPELYDLATDPAEATDLAAARPDDLAALRALWDVWDRDNVEPAFESNTEHRVSNKQGKAKGKKKAKSP
ncbi:MAG: sulfatase-like hydrolase/transferase [Alphaproteobacteria bacterium]|nr:sulfatase-like hydrolase/transferase [Alphaproteobacteria bacterium]